ncbi:class I SAM-dependent methyltransferase [Roseovarius sp. S1116L3]|uniref:class I SAM-dependent methyltransferase n=1 Tax=Roseovarius roseus TaxID=3342636 RepID=UPI00372CADCF
MLSFVQDFLANVETDIKPASRDAALAALRPLGLTDFAATLWASPLPDYRLLARHLPPMSPTEVQARWTGSQGVKLLSQSLSFVQSCSENYTAFTEKTLHNARILDFGCGYGRFLRLFSYYSDNVFGCDAWEASLDQSREAGFGDRVRKSDSLPERLPFDAPFDFAFAFSVFTHLNEHATRLCLRALHNAVKKGGVLCITIRPPDYWEDRLADRKMTKETLQHFLATHQQRGFAFLPHGTKPDDPGNSYGDSSMTLDRLAELAEGWKIVALDRALDDPMQRYVFLQAI